VHEEAELRTPSNSTCVSWNTYSTAENTKTMQMNPINLVLPPLATIFEETWYLENENYSLVARIKQRQYHIGWY